MSASGIVRVAVPPEMAATTMNREFQAVVLVIKTSKGKQRVAGQIHRDGLLGIYRRDWRDPRYAEPLRGYMLTHVPSGYGLLCLPTL